MAGARLLALVLVVLLAAVPAAADEEPHVTDPCGDTVLYAETPGQTVSAPDPRERPMDIRAAWFTSVFDEDDDEGEVFLGMDVTLQLCGPASLPGRGESLRVLWDVDDPDYDCYEYVHLFRGSVVGSLETHIAVWYVHNCPDPYGLGYYRALTDRLSLERDLTIAGDTITWSLRLDEVPPNRRRTLEAGNVWRNPRALTNGPTPNRTVWAGVNATRVTVAALCDEAGPGRDVLVGG